MKCQRVLDFSLRFFFACGILYLSKFLEGWGMEMDVVVLFGSPREDGNTDGVLRFFLDNAADFGFGEFDHVRIFHAFEVLARPCVDCGFCRENRGKCCFEDLDFVFEKISECDLLIVASPIYNYSFPAPLKAIFDRCQRFFEKSKSPESFTGQGVLLVTSGSSGKRDFELFEMQGRLLFSTLNKKFSGKLMLGDTDATPFDEVPEEFLRGLFVGE